jgi:hypothetical protein
MLFQSLRHHGSDLLKGLSALRSDRLLMEIENRAAWSFFKLLFMGAGLALVGVQAARVLRHQGRGDVVAAFARISVLLVTIASAVFFPWYLLAVLPFFIGRTNREWTLWLALVSVISNGLNLPRLTDHASIVYRLLDPLFTYATIFLFLYAFGRRFVRRPLSTATLPAAFGGRFK